MLSTYPVLTHGTEGSAPSSLCFGVVSFEPKGLHFWVVVRCEVVVFDDVVKFLEVPPMERYDGFGFEDALVRLYLCASR